jgi:hypothetical protein
LLKIFTGDGAGNRGLSCAGQAVEPEDALLALSSCPFKYFPKNIDAGVFEASIFMLAVV